MDRGQHLDSLTRVAQLSWLAIKFTSNQDLPCPYYYRKPQKVNNSAPERSHAYWSSLQRSLLPWAATSPEGLTDLEFVFLLTKPQSAGKAVVRNPKVPNHEGWTYFRPGSCNVKEATCGDSVWMLDTWAALPLRNFLTQVVFRVSAKCTENDATATAPMMMGTPTDGLTTHHIFP